LFLLNKFKALTGLLCADVPFRNYLLTQFKTSLAFLTDTINI